MAVSTEARGKGKNANKMTPEIYFARKLASNDKRIRDRSLKKLRRWIAARSAVPDAFSEDELMKLWKGLFYCMWMSDKPLIQEDLAETISGLVHSIVDRKTALKFISISLKVIAKDWSGIDTWRMDKFLMFVRRIIRHSLEYLAKGGWKEEEVEVYSKMLSDTIINANTSITNITVPIGLQTHLINLFPEELAKAGGDGLSSPVILEMLKPFIKCLATSNDHRLRKDVYQFVFTYLIKQSDEALAYEELGLEKQAIISMSDQNSRKRKSRKGRRRQEAAHTVQKGDDEEETYEKEMVESDDDGDAGDADDVDDELAEGDGDDDMEMEESNFDWGAKDPRAGGVDVVLPQLSPDYNKLADMLFEAASGKTIRGKNRKALYDLVKKFRDLHSGIYPLAIKFPEVGKGLTPRQMKAAAKNFIKDQLRMSEESKAEKEELRTAKTNPSWKAKMEDNIEDVLADDIGEFEVENDEDIESGEEADEEGGSDFSDLDDEDEDEEEEGDDEEDEDEDDDEDEELDTSEEEELTDEDDDAAAEEEEEEDSITRAKGNSKKAFLKPFETVKKFEVENNWEEDNDPTPVTSMHQLKQKIKAGKRPKNPGWTETTSEGEIEIVIPNKKFKGAADKLKTPQRQTIPESPKVSSSGRRVNFVLNKNTAQEPKDYQESIRKSPGVPHDPDRQPSKGGVLKQTRADRSNLASPSLRKPQHGGRNGALAKK